MYCEAWWQIVCEATPGPAPGHRAEPQRPADKATEYLHRQRAREEHHNKGEIPP
jgi:hypothetical protein